MRLLNRWFRWLESAWSREDRCRRSPKHRHCGQRHEFFPQFAFEWMGVLQCEFAVRGPSYVGEHQRAVDGLRFNELDPGAIASGRGLLYKKGLLVGAETNPPAVFVRVGPAAMERKLLQGIAELDIVATR